MSLHHRILFSSKISISLTIIIVELHTLSNRIRKFLNFALPFGVFIHPCRIGEEWLLKVQCVYNGLVHHVVNCI